jgi:hypothetical protein
MSTRGGSTEGGDGGAAGSGSSSGGGLGWVALEMAGTGARLSTAVEGLGGINRGASEDAPAHAPSTS